MSLPVRQRRLHMAHRHQEATPMALVASPMVLHSMTPTRIVLARMGMRRRPTALATKQAPVPATPTPEMVMVETRPTLVATSQDQATAMRGTLRTTQPLIRRTTTITTVRPRITRATAQTTTTPTAITRATAQATLRPGTTTQATALAQTTALRTIVLPRTIRATEQATALPTTMLPRTAQAMVQTTAPRTTLAA